MREAIVAAARRCVGMEGPEPWAREAGVKLGPNDLPEWCGLFRCAVMRRVGVRVPDWKVGDANLSYLKKTSSPKPGDIVTFAAFGHQCIYGGELASGGYWTIDGNSTGGRVAIVKRSSLSAAQAVYSAEHLMASPGAPAARMELGIDVSAHQVPGKMKWDVARSLGYTFAYIRGVSMGRSLDQSAQEHVRRARIAGLRVGLYGFFNPREELEIQYRLLVEAHELCDVGKGDLSPVLDLESVEGQYAAEPSWEGDAELILGALRERYGSAMRYHNYADWVSMGRPEFKDFPLWAADYSGACDLSGWTAWQHAPKNIPGAYPVPLDWSEAHHIPKIQ